MADNYDYKEIIGKGMYAKVYKALNKEENKYYAIKCLNFKDITEKERLSIETEVNLLKKLKHPNIVLYKDSFIDKENNLNIVTTFCEGGDMYKKIFREKNNYFEEDQIKSWLVQLLLGLSYIHDKQIVHRDIKTKNIFVQNEHTLRIGDFGIAKIFNQAQTMNKIVGTPLYMAPECFKQSKKYNYKSDIWSLGCCVFEMCNLKHAFEGQFFPAVSVKISEGKRAPLNKRYSRELKELVDGMLDLKPRHRPTIANILERPFMRVKVGEYIKDFINNYKKYDGTEEQINILKEQAEKFQIFKININNEINIKMMIDKKNKSFLNNNYINTNNKNNEKLKSKNYKMSDKINNNSNINKYNIQNETDKMGYMKNNNYNADGKMMNFKKSLSPSKPYDFIDKKYINLIQGKNKDILKNNIEKINYNSKKEISYRESSGNNFKEKKSQNLFHEMNKDLYFPDRKTDFEIQNKKKIVKQHSSNDYNYEFNKEYLSNKINNNNYFNNYIDYEDVVKKDISEDFYNSNNDLNSDNNNNLDILEDQQNSDEEIDENINREKMSDKSYIINKRINFFKERCLKSLGNNFYNKAYNYLKNDRKNNFSNKDKIREHLTNTFGKNNIGYWQLIDQILLLEEILEKS